MYSHGAWATSSFQVCLISFLPLICSLLPQCTHGILTKAPTMLGTLRTALYTFVSLSTPNTMN